MILEWFLTTRMAATTPRISIFTLSLPKKRAFLKSPQCLHPYFSKLKKYIDKRFSPLQNKSIGKPKFGIWAKLDEIKKAKNCCKRNCSAEIGELSSVKNLFWNNHAIEIARKSSKRKTFRCTDFSDKLNWIINHLGELRKKCPKNAQISLKSLFR